MPSDGSVDVTGRRTYATPSCASSVPASTYYSVVFPCTALFRSEAASGCADEPVTVGKASPEVATSQEPASGTVGATFKDKATISGLFGAKPAGSVRRTHYGTRKSQ